MARRPTIAECDAILTAPGMPWETEEVTIRGQKHLSWKNAPKNFRTLVLSKMKEHADLDFFSSPILESDDFAARETFTHGQTYDMATRRAAWMYEKGCRTGSRVAIVGANCTQWIVSYTACHILGAVPVLVNSTLVTESIVHCLAITNPVIALVDYDMAKALGPLRSILRAKKVGDVYAWSPSWAINKLSANIRSGLSKIYESTPSAEAMAAVIDGIGLGLETLGPESDGTIFFTSGTTGYPKGVLSDQRAALHNTLAGGVSAARNVLRRGGSVKDVVAFPPKQPIVLMAVPFFHVTGCMSWLTRGWTQRYKFIITRRFNIPEIVQLIKDEGITVIGGVPAIVTGVMQSPLLPKDKMFDAISFGGAPSADRTASDLKARWPNAAVQNGWGMTETNGVHCSIGGIDYLERPKSTGPTLPVCQTKVCDPITGKECKPFEMGIIFTRGPNIMVEYVGNPTATAKALSSDGWLDTGDMGYLDDDEFLYIADRAKDIIIRGGENIASAEVENAIARDSRIAEVAAVPVPCPKMGERVGVHVSLAPGHSPATVSPQSIMDIARDKLRSAARPAIIVISDVPLPRNANGKIVKTESKKIVGEVWKDVQAGEQQLKARL